MGMTSVRRISWKGLLREAAARVAAAGPVDAAWVAAPRAMRPGTKRALAAAVFHDDDHGFGVALCEEVVEDEVDAALIGPAGFIFAGAVLEIEDRVALGGGGVVVGRGVDEGAAPGFLNFGEVGLDTDGAVGHVLGGVEVAVGVGDVDGGEPFGDAEEGLGAGVVDGGAVDEDCVVVEAEG